MARRKDHTPQQLKRLILNAAENIIESEGLKNLTARALAAAVGYTPGTIYNVYRDMDALIVDINYGTLGRLQELCARRAAALPPDFTRVTALAYAYVDFAYDNVRAWETIFAVSRKNGKQALPPKYYQQRLAGIFKLIEAMLQECLNVPATEAPDTARLLWACLHGITVLTLDGRLQLTGSDDPRRMIDNLLSKYLAEYL